MKVAHTAGPSVETVETVETLAPLAHDDVAPLEPDALRRRLAADTGLAEAFFTDDWTPRAFGVVSVASARRGGRVRGRANAPQVLARRAGAARDHDLRPLRERFPIQ